MSPTPVPNTGKIIYEGKSTSK